MKICLTGYMGSGKTTIGKALSLKTHVPFIDLDEYIEIKEKQSIPEIFKNRGEIYFRKIENQYLKELLTRESLILSTGGGTPIFYNSMDSINASMVSFYLQNSPAGLAERLMKEKSKRPLIQHLKDEELTEFIAKHLFERNQFYRQSHYIIATQEKSIENLVEEILMKFKAHHQNPS
ncbi:MAG: shikimate kinase [Weeksellaceae bacterium]